MQGVFAKALRRNALDPVEAKAEMKEVVTSTKKGLSCQTLCLLQAAKKQEIPCRKKGSAKQKKDMS
ncbi:MAG: hypothetical protein ACLTSZ_03570 [Lachnospiraceae bacterium]